MLALAVTLLLQAPGLPVDSSTKVVWSTVLSSPNNDWINDIVRLKNGDVVAVGFLNRNDGDPVSDWTALLLRFREDNPGARQWDFGAGKGLDAFWTLAEDAKGNLHLSGFTSRVGGGGIDGLTAVVDPSGKLLNESSHGGAGYERLTSIVPAKDGGFLHVGHTESDAKGARDFFLVKTGPDGSTQWRKTYGGPASDGGLYIAPSPNGGYVLSGNTNEGGDTDMLAIKVDEVGKELWQKRLGAKGTNDINHGVIVHPDGRILLVGYSQSWGSGSNDVVAMTLSPDGELIKHEAWGGSDDDRVICAKRDSTGSVWITGYTKSAGAGGWDAYIAQINPDGSFAWEGSATLIGGPKDDNGTALLPLENGDLLFACYSRGLKTDSEDIALMRLAKPNWQAPNPKLKVTKIK